jgi:SH3-like domain-containing protein
LAVKRPAAILCAIAALAGAARARAPDRPTPSGFPVPRWVSLKFGQVNARSGPGDDYPTVWTYEVRRLPVLVVEETREWRKICDPDGQTAWVHKRTVDGARTVFRAADAPLPLAARPEAKAPLRAVLQARSLADLDRCEDGWCRIHVDGVRGWAPAEALWGTGKTRRCR